MGDRHFDAVACWAPHWFNLDQELEVAQRSQWWFWDSRPDHGSWSAGIQWPLPESALYFANDTRQAGQHLRRATVLAVRHRELGQMQRITTSRFGVYEFETTDGRLIEVEAEEDPGRANDPAILVADWTLAVDLTHLTEPLVP